MRFRSIFAGSITSVVLVVSFEACSSNSDHPAPSTISGEAGAIPEGGLGNTDSGDGSSGDSAACHNTMPDGDETDTDCGGSTCPKCALGKKCLTASDCAQGGQCENNICALCHDGVTNGDETATDCGGKACGPCTVGKQCLVASDCKSNSCVATACACPTNMTIVPLAAGGGYCIDTSEVSKGQYNQFITANVPAATQTGPCLASNPNFVPRYGWPPATSPGPLAFNLGLPVHYVNWCDAAAYCKWAKKEMCGAIGGGAVAPADGNNPAKSAWYNACSIEGVRTWPYAGPYSAGTCNGNGTGQIGPNTTNQTPERAYAFGFTENQDNGVYDVAASDPNGVIMNATHTACAGGTVGVYQMSGNVAEWENSCDDTTTATALCRVRGGSYLANDDSAALQCNAQRSVERMPPPPANNDPLADPLRDIGIRCCVY